MSAAERACTGRSAWGVVVNAHGIDMASGHVAKPLETVTCPTLQPRLLRGAATVCRHWGRASTMETCDQLGANEDGGSVCCDGTETGHATSRHTHQQGRWTGKARPACRVLCVTGWSRSLQVTATTMANGGRERRGERGQDEAAGRCGVNGNARGAAAAMR